MYWIVYISHSVWKILFKSHKKNLTRLANHILSQKLRIGSKKKHKLYWRIERNIDFKFQNQIKGWMEMKKKYSQKVVAHSKCIWLISANNDAQFMIQNTHNLIYYPFLCVSPFAMPTTLVFSLISFFLWCVDTNGEKNTYNDANAQKMENSVCNDIERQLNARYMQINIKKEHI